MITLIFYTCLNSSDEQQEQRNESRRRAAEYTFSKPWDQGSNHAADELQREVEALNYELTAPWTEDATDEDTNLRKKMDAISGYQYEPIWKPEEQTERRKQQMLNYKMDTPFQTKYTPPAEPQKPSKKPMPGHNPRSLAPWAHGNYCQYDVYIYMNTYICRHIFMNITFLIIMYLYFLSAESSMIYFIDYILIGFLLFNFSTTIIHTNSTYKRGSYIYIMHT